MQIVIKAKSATTTETRAYKSAADRNRAWTQLKRRHNYFVKFVDVGRPALMFGHADWVKPGTTYTDA